MTARRPGLVAHVIEEQTIEKPMRRIDPVNHGCDGPQGICESHWSYDFFIRSKRY
jgi:hypothetical protein